MGDDVDHITNNVLTAVRKITMSISDEAIASASALTQQRHAKAGQAAVDPVIVKIPKDFRTSKRIDMARPSDNLRSSETCFSM